MKSITTHKLLTICAAVLLSGCAIKPLPAEVAFCDVEELRVFSQYEVDWRAENAPTNFRKDLKTNKTGKRECGWGLK